MPTACLHFAWRTTSLRVDGLAARPSCLAGLRRGGSGRARDATARRTPTQTRHRTHLSGGWADSKHTATPDTTKQSCLCRVWREFGITDAATSFQAASYASRKCGLLLQASHVPRSVWSCLSDGEPCQNA